VKGDIGDMAQDVPVNFESKEFDIPSSWKEMRFEISSDELTKQTYVKWAPKLGQTSKVVP
jgi:hypothetical protein